MDAKRRQVGPYARRVTPGRDKGFTLYELLVTLAIASVLAAMSFRVGAVLHDSRLSTTANELLTHLALARSEAVKRQLPVSVCKSANGMQCNGDLSWADGWLVFVDIDRDGNIDADDTIVWTSSRPGELMRFVYRGFPGGTPRFVTFLPTGFTNEQNGTFYICDHRGAGPTREVVLDKPGRARGVDQSTTDRARHCS